MCPVSFLPPARQYFKKLKDKKLKKIYEDAIKLIRKNPGIGTPKIGDLQGIIGYDIYYNSVNYEIAYRISLNNEGQVVVVIMAGTRENFWDAVKKYIK